VSKSILSARHYLDPEIHRAEQQRIFRTLWIFAGVKQLLVEPDAFLTRTIGGVPVVVQNCGGELHAFENQCAHRQMPIQFEDYGQRRLVCRYHGWVYADDGRVRAMPDERMLYRYPDAEREALCLKQFAVRTIGNLVFVNLSETPLPIESQFRPELMAELEEMSAHFSGETIFARIPARYNWKLNFENILDYNHVPYVHPRSFQPLLPGGVRSPAPAPDEATGKAGLRDLSVSTSSPYMLTSQPWHSMVERFGDSDRYYNFYLYPNVNFISLAGYVFLIQQFDPVAPDRTDVLFTLMTAREKRRMPAMPAILWGHLRGEKRVLDEDIALLEKLQASLNPESASAHHGAYEARLIDVARIYSGLMGEAA
jgi:phenylpropionate dioxygenase-like ring-hydroxylating dioxygenase large terminal subunit